MLEFLFLILCFIYSLFILDDIIKYLKLYLIFNLYFILYLFYYYSFLTTTIYLSIIAKNLLEVITIYIINLYIYCHHLKFSSIQFNLRFYACFYPFYSFYSIATGSEPFPLLLLITKILKNNPPYPWFRKWGQHLPHLKRENAVQHCSTAALQHCSTAA